MTQKNKSYNIKFSYDVIRSAFDEFYKCLDEEGRNNLYNEWSVGYKDHSWDFDSEDQFILAYKEKNIISAGLWQQSSGAKFNLDYRKSFDEQKTTVSIRLPKVDDIEKVFEVFEKKYVEQVKSENEIIDISNSFESVHTSYRLKKQMPSTIVDKKLLIELETYILQRVGQLDDKEKEKYFPEYSVYIRDSSGSHSLKRITAYAKDDFDNNIKALTLGYGRYSGLEISLTFAVDKSDTELDIAFSGESARDIVQSIENGIMKILNETKTLNFLYHPHFALITILFWVFSAALIGVIMIFIANRTFSQSLIAITLILGVYFQASRLKPYTTFDTRRNREILKWSKWLFEVILAILITWLIYSLFPFLAR